MVLLLNQLKILVNQQLLKKLKLQKKQKYADKKEIIENR